MNKTIMAACSLTAALALSGCAAPAPRPQATMQSNAPLYTGSTAAYDGYYDGYYGPHAGGHWGQDGAYYYFGRDGNYHRDDRGHYRRNAFQGGTPFHLDNRYGGTDNRNVQTHSSAHAGYYDGHYGPHIGGYWGQDGAYHYLGRDGNYRRDDRGHYRRDAFQGGMPFRADFQQLSDGHQGDARRGVYKNDQGRSSKR